MTIMRKDWCNVNQNNVNRWLQNARSIAERWGKDRIPLHIKDATNNSEDLLAKQGHFISPIFRSSVPKLVNARCEHVHSLKTSTFLHVYEAKNGNTQSGDGIPDNNMVGFKRNQLSRAEITYQQLDGTAFTIRTQNMQSGRCWRNFIVNVWSSLERAANANETQKKEFYRDALNFLNTSVVKFGHGFFPQSLRAVIHELQDHFNEPRTVFLPAV